MELIKLLGVLIVIVGFALKLDSILIIFLALITTGIVGGLGVGGLLETIGTNFVANRSMAIFMMILLVTGTLERNGLREAAANLIKKVKSATAGKLIAVYGVLNGLFGAFNVGFGGVAGFIRPVLLPMAEGAVKNQGHEPKEEHMEEIKTYMRGHNLFDIFYGRYKKEEKDLLKKYIEIAPRDEFSDILDAADSFIYFQSKTKQKDIQNETK